MCQGFINAASLCPKYIQAWRPTYLKDHLSRKIRMQLYIIHLHQKFIILTQYLISTSLLCYQKKKKKKTLRKTAQFLWWEINAMQWVHNKWTGMQGKKYKSNIWYFGIPGTASTMWRLLAASFQNWENLAVWRWKQRNIIKISVLSLYANSDIQPKYMVSRPNEYAVKKKKKHTSK